MTEQAMVTIERPDNTVFSTVTVKNLTADGMREAATEALNGVLQAWNGMDDVFIYLRKPPALRMDITGNP